MDWSRLKSIADIRFVKSMYIWIFIVPVLATALSKVENLVNVTIFGYSFELVTQLPFSWTAFFFSAFLFVIANAIYFYHCPNVIKEHSDYSDFKAHGKTKYHLLSYSMELDYSWDEILGTLEGNEAAMQELMPLHQEKSEDSSNRNVYWAIQEKADKHKPKARRMASWCYIIAGLLLALVLAQNFLTVAEHGINSVLHNKSLSTDAQKCDG